MQAASGDSGKLARRRVKSVAVEVVPAPTDSLAATCEPAALLRAVIDRAEAFWRRRRFSTAIASPAAGAAFGSERTGVIAVSADGNESEWRRVDRAEGAAVAPSPTKQFARFRQGASVSFVGVSPCADPDLKIHWPYGGRAGAVIVGPQFIRRRRLTPGVIAPAVDGSRLRERTVVKVASAQRPEAAVGRIDLTPIADAPTGDGRARQEGAGMVTAGAESAEASARRRGLLVVVVAPAVQFAHVRQRADIGTAGCDADVAAVVDEPPRTRYGPTSSLAVPGLRAQVL